MIDIYTSWAAGAFSANRTRDIKYRETGARGAAARPRLQGPLQPSSDPRNRCPRRPLPATIYPAPTAPPVWGAGRCLGSEAGPLFFALEKEQGTDDQPKTVGCKDGQ